MKLSISLKYAILTLSFLTTVKFAYTQDTSFYFFRNVNRGSKLVQSLDSADFIRAISTSSSPEQFVIVNEYFKNGKLRFKATGIASSFTKSQGLVSYQGSAVGFFPSGKRRVITNFKNGQKDGLEYYYYPDGKLYMVANHKEDKQFGGYTPLIIDCYNKSGDQICKEGNGTAIEYDNEFNQGLSGRVINGNHEGDWNGAFLGADTIKYTFIYKKGFFKSGIGYDKHGNVYPFDEPYRTAHPPNGYVSFIENFKGNIKVSKNSGISNAEIDSTDIIFLVDKEGHLKDLKTRKLMPPAFMDALLISFDKCKKWEPTRIYGVPHESNVTFSLHEEHSQSGNLVGLKFSIVPLRNGLPFEPDIY